MSTKSMILRKPFSLFISLRKIVDITVHKCRYKGTNIVPICRHFRTVISTCSYRYIDIFVPIYRHFRTVISTFSCRYVDTFSVQLGTDISHHHDQTDIPIGMDKAKSQVFWKKNSFALKSITTRFFDRTKSPCRKLGNHKTLISNYVISLNKNLPDDAE